MANDFGTLWANGLSRYSERFEGRDALHVGEGRRHEIKRRYLAALSNCHSAGESFRRTLETAQGHISGLSIESVTELRATEDGAELISHLAIPEEDLSILQFPSEEAATEFSRFGICAVIRELALARQGIDLISIIQINPVFLDYFSRYALAREARDRRIEGQASLIDAGEFTKEVKQARNDLAEQQDGVISEFRKRMENISAEISACESKISATATSISNFKNRVGEDLILKQIGVLWSNRASASKKAFWVGLLGTFALLIGTAVAVIYFHSQISTYLKEVATQLSTGQDANATPVSAAISQIRQLIFISIPLVVVLWLARFGMRFTMRSLALYDDAKQRDVMLNTYIYLTGEGKSQEAHRPLMLNALFRPLPGQPGLDVEPPNWAELMKVSTGEKG